MTEDRRRLLLVRHAKAKTGDDDRLRPLSRSGRADAAALGRWMGDAASPDLAVVSPSRRTVETWNLAAAELAEPARALVDNRLYAATVRDLLDVVRGVETSAACLALVGHNPSMQELFLQLAGDEDGAEALRAFPTATVALFDVMGVWSDMRAAHASLVAVATCRA